MVYFLDNSILQELYESAFTKITKRKLQGIISILLSFLWLSCNKQSDQEIANYYSNSQLFSATVKKINDVVLMNNFPPVIASRNYVYSCIAAYECISQGYPKEFESCNKFIPHFPNIRTYNQDKKINYQFAALLALIKVGNAVTFPEGVLMSVYEEVLKNADSVGVDKNTIENSRRFSDSIAAKVLLWSKRDNYAQTRSSSKFIIKKEMGRWTPTPPQYMDALEPHWKEIRPMILKNAGEIYAPKLLPIQLKNKQNYFYKASEEVRAIGNNLTDEQKHIADFWDDNPFKINVVGHVRFATKKFSPPGHWLNIMGIAAKHKNETFNNTVALFAQGTVALFDAFISCWNQKYNSNSVRPETAINQYIQNDWTPYIQTPPFPSYVSGHATISAAIAEILTARLGNNCSFIDTSSLEFGIKSRKIETFRAAAKEAAMSRLYGGIHYRFDNNEGNIMGVKIGHIVLERMNLFRQTFSEKKIKN